MVRYFKLAEIILELLHTYAITGSRGPAVLDDFTSSYGYKFSDPAGYQWGNVDKGPGSN